MNKRRAKKELRWKLKEEYYEQVGDGDKGWC